MCVHYKDLAKGCSDQRASLFPKGVTYLHACICITWPQMTLCLTAVYWKLIFQMMTSLANEILPCTQSFVGTG